MLVLAGWSAILFTGCANKAQQNFDRPPAPVSVTEAIAQDVPTYLDAIGKTVAREVVSIQPQVSGRITKIHFTDGANVKKGELLFTIDTRPFEASLRQAQANVSKDDALKKQAEANLAREIAQAKWGETQVKRYRKLVEQGSFLGSSTNSCERTRTLLTRTSTPLAPQFTARMKRSRWTRRRLRARRCNSATATFARLSTVVPVNASWISETLLTLAAIREAAVRVIPVPAAMPCW